MKKIVFLVLALTLMVLSKEPLKIEEDKRIDFHVVDLKKSELNMYLKDDKGTVLKSFGNLKEHLKKQRTSFCKGR